MALRTRQILLALLAPLLLLFVVAPALSASNTGYGTPAWSKRALTLTEGPGRGYGVVATVPRDQPVTVYRCSLQWCLIGQGHANGWTRMSGLNFGLPPARVVSRLRYPSGGPGQVCLFEGRNYTGASICAQSRQVIKDLLLNHRDNRVSSISVTGNVSALVCRDRNFQSYCVRIVKSVPALNRYLDRQISSIRVY